MGTSRKCGRLTIGEKLTLCRSGLLTIWATAKKRGTERHLAEAVDVLNEVESSPVMQKLWESYRRKFSYAADLEWNIIMGAVRSLYALSEKESSL